VSYEIRYSEEAQKYLNKVPQKHARHIYEKTGECLTQNPKGKTPHCNIKPIEGSNPKVYRFHISMTYTLFYSIDEKCKCVYVIFAMGINQAHSKYGIL